MLGEILKFISEKSNFSTSAISEGLNLPMPMIDDIKSKLVNMGYIEKIECSSETCEQCSCGCGKVKNLNGAIEWRITDKGNKFISRIGG